jgi:hypothetical protein
MALTSLSASAQTVCPCIDWSRIMQNWDSMNASLPPSSAGGSISAQAQMQIAAHTGQVSVGPTQGGKPAETSHDKPVPERGMKGDKITINEDFAHEATEVPNIENATGLTTEEATEVWEDVFVLLLIHEWVHSEWNDGGPVLGKCKAYDSCREAEALGAEIQVWCDLLMTNRYGVETPQRAVMEKGKINRENQLDAALAACAEECP